MNTTHKKQNLSAFQAAYIILRAADDSTKQVEIQVLKPSDEHRLPEMHPNVDDVRNPKHWAQRLDSAEKQLFNDNKNFGFTQEDFDRIKKAKLTDKQVEVFDLGCKEVSKKLSPVLYAFSTAPENYFNNPLTLKNFRSILTSLAKLVRRLPIALHIYQDLKTIEKKRQEVKAAPETEEKRFNIMQESIEDLGKKYNVFAPVFLKLVTKEDLQQIVDHLIRLRTYLQKNKHDVNERTEETPRGPLEPTQV